MDHGVELADGDWLDRVEWSELIDGALQLLTTARSAVIYLARTIDLAEQKADEARRAKAEDEGKPLLIPPLPSFRAVTENAEFD